MKKNDINRGRINQKLKTRSEILEAARSLMPKSQKITLDDVAKKANISRATIYRYFSSIDLLITEASLDVRHKTPDEIFEEVKEMSFAGRVLHIQKQYVDIALNNEVVFRRFLSAVLTESIVTKKQLRGARRIEALEKALAPFKSGLARKTYKNLINASSILMGIDPVVTSKDVCKLNNKEIKATLEWALDLIIKGVMREHPSL